MKDRDDAFVVKTFSELTAAEVYEILRSRAEVFIKEQGIRCTDPDGVDYESLHVFRIRKNRVDAYLRAYRVNDETMKIGRVLTLKHGQGIGTKLMQYAMHEIPQRTGCRRIVMDAQKQALSFYDRLGFQVEGDEYLEEGIVHVDMTWETSAAYESEQAARKEPKEKADAL